MSDKELQDKMAAIGVRYLARTEGEAQDLLRLVEQLPVGGATTMKEIELLAHRIRGSGAVFGFQALSDAARDIEMLALGSIEQPVGDVSALVATLSGQVTALIDVLNATRNAASASH